MKRILVASLISTFALAAVAATAQPANNANSAAPVHISTGVIAPKLETVPVVQINGDEALAEIPNPASMLLRVSLDNNGAVTRIQIVNPLSPDVDAQVVSAVRHFHWTPASLDNQKIPDTVDLAVEVQH